MQPGPDQPVDTQQGTLDVHHLLTRSRRYFVEVDVRAGALPHGLFVGYSLSP